MVDWISLLLTVVYSGILCYIEIPSLVRYKQYKELGVFIILLGTGTLFAIIIFSGKSLPNPSDLLMWIFLPFKGIIQSLLR